MHFYLKLKLITLFAIFRAYTKLYSWLNSNFKKPRLWNNHRKNILQINIDFQ